ncbi:MAG: ComEC/Rec2 family competence protein [Lachnospirales bacterium]
MWNSIYNRKAVVFCLLYMVLIIFNSNYTYVDAYFIHENDYAFSLFNNLREYLITNSNFYSGDYRNFVNALVLGINIDGQIREQMISIGIFHIFSLSGLHVGIVYFALDRLIVRNKPTLTKCVFISLVLISYGVMTGLKVSMVRAIIMCVISAFGRVFYRYSDTLNSLAIASIFILLVNPYMLYSISFQLSFNIVFGIIVYSDLLNKIKGYNFKGDSKGVLSKFIDYVIIGISAFLVSFPLNLYYFGASNILSLFANLLVAFAIPLIFVFGFISLFIPFFLFIKITEFFISYVFFISTFIEKHSIIIKSDNFDVVTAIVTLVLQGLSLYLVAYFSEMRVKRGIYEERRT